MSSPDLHRQRKCLHLLVDSFWKSWDYTRDEVYDMIRTLSGKDHISDMMPEDMRKVSSAFQEGLLGACSGCIYKGEPDDIGIVRCNACSGPFFTMLFTAGTLGPQQCRRHEAR